MEITGRRFLDTTTASVHAATIEFWKDHPVFAWFGGSREGSGDVAIYLNNLHGDGKTITIGSRDNVPRWNPILFSNNDKLWMFEKAGQFCDRWQTFVHDVTDWDINTTEKEMRSECQIIPAGLNGPVKTKPILLKDDTVLCGSSVETLCDWTSYMEMYSINKSGWEYKDRTSPIAVKDKVEHRDHYGRSTISLGIIQPAVWLDDDGKLNSFFRSSGGLKSIYYSSESNGVWSEPCPTNLLNPNSGVDIVHTKGRTFLVYNPYSDKRAPLVIDEVKKVSDSKWDAIDRIVIRSSVKEDDRRRCVSGELSYPYMVENNGTLNLVYTYGRSFIEYCIVSI